MGGLSIDLETRVNLLLRRRVGVSREVIDEVDRWRW